jgi:uncharacterized protein YjeT (DUF2065 family)
VNLAEFVLTAFGVVIVLAGVAVFAARRAIRRAVRRIGGLQSRYLEVRGGFLPPGPRREAVRLRGRLHAELRATRDLLTTAPQGLIFRADAAGVLRELLTTASELDRELAAIERFLDPVQQRSALDALRPQVTEVIATTYTARQTVLRTAVEDRTRRIATLRDTVAAQQAALENYRRNDRQLNI